MPVSGNGEAQLKLLLKRVNRLSSGTMRLGAAKNLAAEARKQVMDEFREGRDPYGEKWPASYRGGQTLADTARLRNSIKPVATERGFNVHSNVVYASVHNYGGIIRAKAAKYLVFKVKGQWVSKKEVHVPKRQFLPDQRRGIGPIWGAGFVRALNAWLKSAMGQKAA